MRPRTKRAAKFQHDFADAKANRRAEFYGETHWSHDGQPWKRKGSSTKYMQHACNKIDRFAAKLDIAQEVIHDV